jgi:hypothetical protein
MDESDLDKLLADLDQARARYGRVHGAEIPSWRLPLMPRRMKMRSLGLATIWMAFHAGLFVAGCVMVFINPLQNLGQALIVGSLFASGAMGAQLWALAFNDERRIERLTLGELYGYSNLAAAGAEVQRIVDLLKRQYPALDDVEIGRLPTEQIRSLAARPG